MTRFRKNLVLTISLAVLLTAGLAGFAWWWKPGVPASGKPAASPMPSPGYAGSGSCRQCHEKFYQLWAPSHHGLAMQPVTPEFLKTKVKPQKTAITDQEFRYQAVIRDGKGLVQEQGPQGERIYPMVHAMGGKNVYYFLTPLDKGRLQVLPVAYDVRKQEWFDTAASMLRHFGEGARARPLSWRDPLLTFNTACHSCHVSQLATNYDLKTHTYHTVWAEPGINCETCHGPAAEHNRVCQEAPKGTVPKDLKIIRGGRDFTVAQNNATCAPCHAKMVPLTTSFLPGERFFDNFDLVTLEDRDFYPDGRDLGENFTETLWRLSPCAKSGKLSCLHCHTSSGRYRFKDEAKANQACLPCHQERVENAAAHIKHPGDKPGTPQQCIACHMPMTEFARMRRTDHSMLPPTPAATMAFKSPNACNLCHQNQDAAWADEHVRKWRRRNYQGPLLYRAGLVDAARKRDWTTLPAILTYITSPGRDEVYAASLIRLLVFCPHNQKWPAIRQALKDKSPLVRGAAAAALTGHLTPETRDALLACLDDDYRLVRIRAASTLAPYPRDRLSPADQQRLGKASQELITSLLARPDDWSSHYNLGNYYFSRREFSRALESFALATTLRPDSVLPLVNAALTHTHLGQGTQAEAALNQALKLEPENAVANFNLALLLAEKNQLRETEQHLRRALKTDPDFPEAAYNLGVLLATDRPDEGLLWIKKAHQLKPDDPKYAYTLAYYQRQQGDLSAAISTLKALILQHPGYANAYLFLGDIYESQGKVDKAKATYRQALQRQDLAQGGQALIETRMKKLSPLQKKK